MKVLLATENFSSSFKEIFPGLDVYKFDPDKDPPKWEGDLLIFTGGEDINPMMYGQRPAGTHYWNKERDNREQSTWSCYKYGYIKSKKVLGVCRGHQLLNVVMGGQLHQDLHSIGKGHPSGHAIEWTAPVNEKLASIKAVNSLHHQAIAKLGSGGRPVTTLGVEPRTGIIESVLWDNDVLGVQFHPEWLNNDRELFWSVIEDWVNGVPLLGEVPKKEEKKKSSHTDFESISIDIDRFRAYRENVPQTSPFLDLTREELERVGINPTEVRANVVFPGDFEPDDEEIELDEPEV